MRVLISAYACEPGKGSEPGVGLAVALGATRRHEVWVITRQNNIEPVQELLAGHPFADRIHLVGLDLGERALRLKRRLGTLGLYWYYDRWQKRAGELAGELDSEVGFDVIHHITFATIWARIGVAPIQKPLVLGPLGGFAVTPPRLWQVLGPKGLLDELTRRAIRPLMSLLGGSRRAFDAANVLLLQNPTALGRRRPSDRVRVVPNGLVGAESPIEAITNDPPQIVFAGRLIGWKGPVLAVEAMRHLDHPTAVLDIYGSGPDRTRLEKAVTAWGLEDRVRLHGTVPRPRLLEAIARASVLLHPSLHDEAGLVIAEALSAGTPVVCLDLAGPPVVASYWPDEMFRAVPATRRRQVVLDLARAVDELLGKRGEVGSRQAKVFLSTLENAYQLAAREGAIR